MPCAVIRIILIVRAYQIICSFWCWYVCEVQHPCYFWPVVYLLYSSEVSRVVRVVVWIFLFSWLGLPSTAEYLLTLCLNPDLPAQICPVLSPSPAFSAGGRAMPAVQAMHWTCLRRRSRFRIFDISRRPAGLCLSLQAAGGSMSFHRSIKQARRKKDHLTWVVRSRKIASLHLGLIYFRICPAPWGSSILP